MTKIISPLVLAAVLLWTWHIVHSQSAIGFETHSGVQLKLAELIGNTLQAKKPDAENLQIVKIWTAPLNENKIQAVFSYKFTEKSEDGDPAEQLPLPRHGFDGALGAHLVEVLGDAAD
ncbi:MAG: hypothetical protein ACK5V3_02060, partial [Bdellovibrionales bacterium]